MANGVTVPGSRPLRRSAALSRNRPEFARRIGEGQSGSPAGRWAGPHAGTKGPFEDEDDDEYEDDYDKAIERPAYRFP